MCAIPPIGASDGGPYQVAIVHERMFRAVLPHPSPMGAGMQAVSAIALGQLLADCWH